MQRHDLRTAASLLALLTSLGLAACGDENETTETDTGATADTGVQEDTTEDTTTNELCGDELIAELFVNDGISEGTIETIVEGEGPNFASRVTVPTGADAPFLYVRFVEGTAVPLDDSEALESDLWDMAFRSDMIRVNSGISGAGSAMLTGLVGADFDMVDENTGLNPFRSDALLDECADPAVGAEAVLAAIGDWSSEYSSRVYVLETVDGTLIKIRLAAIGTAGGDTTFDLQWGPVEVDDGCDERGVFTELYPPIDEVSDGGIDTTVDGTYFSAHIDASAGGMSQANSNPYVYLDLDTGDQVMITDLEAFDDMTWDLAIKRVVFRANGGISGPANVTLVQTGAASLDEADVVPDASEFTTDNFVDDECVILQDPIGNPLTAFGTWYDYAVGGGGLSVMDYVYFIETTEGAMVRFRIDTYSNGEFDVEWEIL